MTNMMSEKWIKRMFSLADLVASWSKDPSTKVGAVICDPYKRIVSVGFNGFASDILDLEERYEDRDTKYKLVIHAEINAIISARGQIPENSNIFVTHPPCLQCFSQILQQKTSIKHIWFRSPSKEFLTRWKNDFELMEEIIKKDLKIFKGMKTIVLNDRNYGYIDLSS